MRWQWLHRAGAGKLLVFCNGWGMDGEVVSHLHADDLDIVMLFDYAALDIPCEVKTALTAASHRFLLGWSMGVWIGRVLFSEYSFDAAVAYNGTLCPIDKRFGIAPSIFQATLENFNEKHRADFYNRMCSKNDLSFFLQSIPKRAMEHQREELAFFWNLRQQMMPQVQDTVPWQRAVISSGDRIMPARNQRAFWKKRLPLTELNGGHYPFAKSNRWRDYLVL